MPGVGSGKREKGNGKRESRTGKGKPEMGKGKRMHELIAVTRSHIRSPFPFPVSRFPFPISRFPFPAFPLPKTMPYTAAYFDKWYRSAQRVHSPGDRRRTVRLVVGIADYMLGRPIRSVLDIGAGEGQWLGALRRIRGSIRYAGVDPSEYAVARYGRRRHLQLGTLGDLPPAVTLRSYDLVVCSGMLNYIPPAELRAGLADIARLVRGVAFLELFTDRDDVQGDTRGRRPGTFYRAILRDLGFRQCGPHCYIGPEFDGEVVEMELR